MISAPDNENAFGRRAFLGMAMGGAAIALSGTTATGNAKANVAAAIAETDWRKTRLLRACLAGPVKEEIEAMAWAGANVIQCNLNGAVTEGRGGPGILGGDPVGDFVQCVHDLGAKATGYLNTRLAPQLKEHPDWIVRGWNGKSLSGDESPSACENSPYGQYLIDQMAAYTKRFPIDGWWLDCWTFGLQTCWCPFCKAGFTRDSGLLMPVISDLSDPHFQTYLEWRDAMAERFFARMREAVNAARSDVHIWVNFSMGPQNAPLPHNDSVFRMVESPTVEAWLAFQKDNALATPFGIARLKGAAGDREAEIWMVPTALQWERTSTPDVEVLARAYTVLAYGAIVQFPAAPGHVAQMKTVFDAIKAREKWLIGAEPLPWAALVLSYRSAEFYGRDKAIRNYYHEIMGLFRAFSEEHLPVRIITERDVEDGKLSQFRVAVVANGACLSDKANAELRKYVAAGGGLVATHETSLYSEYGKKLNDFALADLLNAHWKGEETFAGWKSDRLWFAKHETTDDDVIQYSKWNCTVSTPREWIGSVDWAGRALNVEAAAGTEVPAKRNGVGNTAATWPAAVLSRYEKGRVAFLPLEAGASYYHTSFPFLRRWFRRTVEWAAAGAPPILVRGPLSLIATYWRQPEQKRTIVQLLNDNSSSGRRAYDAEHSPIREEVIPLSDIEIWTKSDSKHAMLQPNGDKLRVAKNKIGARVTVPRLGQHAIVVLEDV